MYTRRRIKRKFIAHCHIEKCLHLTRLHVQYKAIYWCQNRNTCRRCSSFGPDEKNHANQQLCRPVTDWLSKFNAPFSCSLLEIFSVYWTVNHPLIAITITITITHGSSLLKWIEKYVIEINGFIIMKFDWFQNWLCAGKVYQLTFWLSNSQWKMMLLPFIERPGRYITTTSLAAGTGKYFVLDKEQLWFQADIIEK